MTVAAAKLKPTVFLSDAGRRSLARRPAAALGRLPHRAAAHRRRRTARWMRVIPAARRGWRVAAVLGLTLLLGACASKRVLVAPRLDLGAYQRVGLVTFTIENAKGNLHTFATERFMAEVFAGQQGVAVLELGTAEAVLQEVGATEIDARTAQRIGDAWDVPAVFVGHLTVSDVKPRGVFAGLTIPRMEASVTVSLAIRLLSTESGATIWSNRATASETVGELGMVGGDVVFSAENPNDAYGRLVDYLVYETTHDLRPQWVKP